MSPVFRYTLSFLIITLYAPFADAQIWNPEFVRYNTNNGLSQNNVFCIAQDHQGFLWIGTDDGLNRFDGHEFKIFKYSEDNSNTIVDNTVRALLVARDSSIWIGTNNGVCRYFPATERIVRYPILYENPRELSGSQVSSIQQHPDGSIWISYIGDGINVIIPGQEEIVHYTVNHKTAEFKIRDDLVSAMLFMPDGDKLIGTLSGIIAINAAGVVMKSEDAENKYPWISQIDNTIKSLLLTRDQKTLWITTEENGAYQIDLKSNKVTQYNKSNGHLEYDHTSALQEDREGNIWIGSEVVYFFEKESQKLFSCRECRIEGNELIKNSIYSIFEDRDKNIWIGTFNMGILKYNPVNKQVLHYLAAIDDRWLTNNQILSFAEIDKNRIWVGTDGEGLLEFRLDEEKFYRYPFNTKFSSKVIRSIYKDKKGFLWLGTWEGGMIKLDPAKNKVEIYSPSKNNFNSRHVWDIAEDSLGNLWVGTLRDGLCYFDPHTGKYKYFRNIPTDLTSLVNNDIMALHHDSRGILWIATANGLSVLYPGKNTFTNLYSDGSEKTISSNVIHCLHEDVFGRIWLGTNGGGITILDKDLKIIKVLKEKQGLPSNTISSLQSDQHNDIWASTYKGLAKINYKTLRVEDLPQVGGLREKEFGIRSGISTTDGKLLFGSSHGFEMFNPDSLVARPLRENLVFTSLKIFNDEITADTLYKGRRVISTGITTASEIHLSHQDYSFTLAFAPLTYNWQKTMKYKYFLENLDKDWQYTTSDRRFVHYTNLTPGEYILKVKASLDGVHWPEQTKSIKIIISPPFWRTWWFNAIAILLAASLAYGIFNLRVKFLNSQKRKLEALVEVRTSELKQSNEELREKNSQIEIQHQEIHDLVKVLADQKADIEQKNQELQSINEELQTQHDALEVKGVALEKAQQRLQEINTNLEQLIERRTEKLNEAVRELETFLYRASHDLRGPISSMLGLIRVAELEETKSDDVYLEFFRRTTLQLERTLMKLVQKHTIQKSKISRENITKPIVMRMLNELSRDILHFRFHDFEVHIQDDLLFQTDKGMLEILLTNLLENAFFFSESSGNPRVLLEMKQENGHVNVSVMDHGPGIKSHLKDKIFTMFFRGNEKSTGNGLGLYLVKNALAKIHGTIALETKEGSFTRFIVTLTPSNGLSEFETGVPEFE